MADAAHPHAEDAWRAAVAKVLRGAPTDTLTSYTLDGLPIEPLYPPAEGSSVWRDASRPFGIVQRVDHPEPDAALALARSDLDGGATGLVLVGATSATASGFGIAAADLPDLLDGLPLGRTSLRLDLSAAEAPAALDAVLVAAERQGYAPDALEVDGGLDPLVSGDALRANVERLRERGLAGPLVRADGRHHAVAGASEAQELAATLSAGVAALRALEPLGLDAARGAISFVLAADQHQLLTTAKFRAFRRLWAAVETACGLVPLPIRLHAETGWRSLARSDPHTNILRTAIAAAGAIIGGADGLTVLPFTSPLGLPDGFARRVARNTPLVLLAEASLDRVADPAAGAGAFEALTDALAREAWAQFQALERQGGLAAATASGGWTDEVAAMGEKRQAAIADGRTALVGVTCFANPAETLPSVLLPAANRPDALPGGDGPTPLGTR